MRLLAIVTILATVSSVAVAQTPAQPPPSPQEQASKFMIDQLTSEKMGLLTQLVAAQQTIADLNKQLMEAKKLAATEPPKPSP